MDNIKNDFYYVKRLLQSIEITTRYLGNKSMDDLIGDGYLCDAIENRFTKIAEDASNLSKEFKKTIKEIPWDAISSIRNRVCHDYDVVDFSILFKVIKTNFPEFKEALLKAIKPAQMNLWPEPFAAIKNKAKTVEMRLFDGKRQQLKTGDLIIFSNLKTGEKIIVEIIELKRFSSFEELYANYSKIEIGYKNEELADSKDMLAYYSEESIAKYGVLAIEIKAY